MDNKVVLSKAVLRTAEKLGLSMDQLAQVLSVEHAEINQVRMALDPTSKPGQKALLLIQMFQSLYALTGGDVEWIRHFMRSPNLMTGGIPIEQIQYENGLVIVLEYLHTLLTK